MVRRPLLLLSAAALAPITLGIAMHLEHVAAAEACTADLDAWTAIPTTSTAPADANADSIVPRSMPIPVPVAEPITDHAMPFAFVVDIQGPHIVLATTVDERWIDGPPRFRGQPNDEEHYAILDRNVAIAQLPPEVLAAVGRRMRVYSADGEVCTARIGMPQLVGELWGDLYEWGPEESQGVSPEQQSWEVSRRTLVAPLATDGECGTPLWARDAALPAPAVFTRTDGHVPKAARKALLADPGVRDYARDMRQEFERVRENSEDKTSPIPTLLQRSVGQRWQDARGHEVFTLAFTGEEFGGCGGFELAWSAYVPTEGAGVTAIDRAGDDVLAVVDLDRDGRVEVLTTTWMGPTRLVEIGGADALRERASLDDVPFFGCPC